MGNTTSRDAGASQPPSSCPVPESQRNLGVFNVYNQRVDAQAAQSGLTMPQGDVLDPKNNMPLEPNQQPCPGQKKLLSTYRVQSNIPKGGTDSTWSYPSPQMFYNGKYLSFITKQVALLNLYTVKPVYLNFMLCLNVSQNIFLKHFYLFILISCSSQTERQGR